MIATRQQVLVGLFLGALAACSSPEPTGEDVHRGVEGAGEETGLEVPVLTVSSPARGAFVGTDPVTVEGHVSEGSAPISSVTVGDMSAIVIDRVHIYSSHQGIGIDWRGAGNLHGAVLSNINIHSAQCDGSGSYDDPHWMGNAQPIVLSADRWRGGPADRGPAPSPARAIREGGASN